MSRLAVAALVLLLTVGALFAAAAWNRSGDVQSIVLTERELALPWRWPSADAEARLRFQWQARTEPQDARIWLPDVKLRELGFTTGVPAGAPEAESLYGRSLPRVAWVAFELNGPAWRLIEQRRAMTREVEPRGGPPEQASRLVPIDAASEPETLRRRHQAGTVIVLPAIIRMRYRTIASEGPSVWAEIESLVSGTVSVPAHLRRQLPGSAAREAPSAPRYEVDLRVGRLGAAWVHDIR